MKREDSGARAFATALLLGEQTIRRVDTVRPFISMQRTDSPAGNRPDRDGVRFPSRSGAPKQPKSEEKKDA
jgi:hypothetical protein